MKNFLLLLLCLAHISALADNHVATLQENGFDSSATLTVDSMIGERIASEKGLRILDIGNSFTDDAVAYLKRIADSSKTDLSNICIYKLMRPSASYKRFVDCYNGKDKGKFYYKKVVGDIECPLTITSSADKQNNQLLFKDVLTSYKWDKIVIHQLSNYSDDFERWLTNGDGGYLKELLDIIRKHQPNAEVGYLLPHVAFKQAENGNTKERWFNVMTSYQKLKDLYGVDFVIPYGTAIENLRTTVYNDEFGLCRDGHHIAFGLARYTAACAYYQSVLYPISHKSILDNKCLYKTTSFEQGTSTHSMPIDVTDENIDLANRCAYLACCFWWKICNPADYENLFK